MDAFAKARSTSSEDVFEVDYEQRVKTMLDV